MKKPLSLIYTQSLANIAKSYSPEKSVTNLANRSNHEKENQSKYRKEVPVMTDVMDKEIHRSISNMAPIHGHVKEDVPEKLAQQNNLAEDEESNEDKENQSTIRNDSANKLQTSLVHEENIEQHAPNEHLQIKVVSPFTPQQESTLSKECELARNFSAENCPTSKDLQTKNYVSPNSYLRDLNETIENMSVNFAQSYSNSPESVLNESVPHDIMLSQLEYVKSNLELNASNKNQCSTHLHASASDLARMQRAEALISNKSCNPFSVVPEGTSPRRTTFTVKRQHQSCKTVNRSTPRALGGKSSINRPKGSGVQKSNSRRSLKQETGRNLMVGRKNCNSAQSSLNDRDKIVSALTPELSTRERHVREIPNSVSLTPEILSESKDPSTLSSEGVPAHVSEMLILPTPERNLLEMNTKESSVKTPLSCHYNNFVLPTPEQYMTRNDTRMKVKTSKETLYHRSVSSVKDSSKYFPDSPLLSDTTNVAAALTVSKETSLASTLHEVVSITVTKEKPTVITQSGKRKSFGCLFSPPKERNPGLSESMNSSGSSFTCTPLPSSPNPDLSRRSTHIVENPKVIDCTQVKRKRLFSSLDIGENEENIPGILSQDSDLDRYDKSQEKRNNDHTKEKLINDIMPGGSFTFCGEIKSTDDQNTISDSSVDKSLRNLLNDVPLKHEVKSAGDGKNPVSEIDDSSVWSIGNDTPKTRTEGKGNLCGRITQLKNLSMANEKLEKNKHSAVVKRNANTKPGTLDRSRKGQVSQNHKAERGRIQQSKGVYLVHT